MLRILDVGPYRLTSTVYASTINAPAVIVLVSQNNYVPNMTKFEMHIIRGESMLDQLLDTGCEGDNSCENMVLVDALHAYATTADIMPCELWLTKHYHKLKVPPNFFRVKLV